MENEAQTPNPQLGLKKAPRNEYIHDAKFSYW